MERNQAGRSWAVKAIAYSASASLAGALAGGVLGLAGGTLPAELRVAAASLLAACAVFVGAAELLGRGVRLPQFDRETPQRWMHKGAINWAVRNGSSLGVGATSRIGFWLWYAVPLGAFLSGNPGLGALVYGAYAAVRGGAVWVLILGSISGVLEEDWGDRFIESLPAARTVAAAHLLLVGVAGTIALGL